MKIHKISKISLKIPPEHRNQATGREFINGPFHQARPSREGFLAESPNQSVLRNRKSRVWEAPQTLPLCSLSIRGTSGRQPNIIETVYDILKFRTTVVTRQIPADGGRIRVSESPEGRQKPLRGNPGITVSLIFVRRRRLLLFV